MIDVHGAYDLHVHSSPDLFPRIAHDRQMVADAAARGFSEHGAAQATDHVSFDEIAALVAEAETPGGDDFRVMCRENGGYLLHG